jgi:hypothetical protein
MRKVKSRPDVVGASFSASQRERSEQEQNFRRAACKRNAKARAVHASIDSLCRAAYTQGSILQAREAGKAVRIGRGPATVIG